VDFLEDPAIERLRQIRPEDLGAQDSGNWPNFDLLVSHPVSLLRG
jgi:hypothetical protein